MEGRRRVVYIIFFINYDVPVCDIIVATPPLLHGLEGTQVDSRHLAHIHLFDVLVPTNPAVSPRHFIAVTRLKPYNSGGFEFEFEGWKIIQLVRVRPDSKQLYNRNEGACMSIDSIRLRNPGVAVK